MTTERPRSSWTCRASLCTARMFGLALALLVALGAVLLFFRSEQLWWLLLAVPVSIWVGFKGGPMLLRMLERAGLFGRVRIEDGRLILRRSSSVIDLSEPFGVDARLQDSRIVREYDLKDMGVTRGHAYRKYTLDIKVLSVLVGQGTVRRQLVGDETNRAPGSAYVTDGLAVRPLPVVKERMPQVRVWGADLAQLLGRLREAAGYSSPALPEQPEPRRDPRRLFCPHWKVAVGTLAILGLFAVGSLAAYQGYVERADAESEAARAEAEKQRQEEDDLGRSLVGRRVTVKAQSDARMVGTVEKYRLQSSTSYDPYRITWITYVSVRVDELVDAEGNVLPDDATVTYMFADNFVKKGDEVEERAADLLEILDATPGAESE